MSANPEQVLAVLAVLKASPELDGARHVLELEAITDALGLNSLNLLRVIVRLENAFNLEFGDDALDRTCFPTVRSLCEYVAERVGQGGA